MGIDGSNVQPMHHRNLFLQLGGGLFIGGLDSFVRQLGAFQLSVELNIGAAGGLMRYVQTVDPFQRAKMERLLQPAPPRLAE